MIEFLV